MTEREEKESKRNPAIASAVPQSETDAIIAAFQGIFPDATIVSRGNRLDISGVPPHDSRVVNQVFLIFKAAGTVGQFVASAGTAIVNTTNYTKWLPALQAYAVKQAKGSEAKSGLSETNAEEVAQLLSIIFTAKGTQVTTSRANVTVTSTYAGGSPEVNRVRGIINGVDFGAFVFTPRMISVNTTRSQLWFAKLQEYALGVQAVADFGARALSSQRTPRSRTRESGPSFVDPSRARQREAGSPEPPARPRRSDDELVLTQKITGDISKNSAPWRQHGPAAVSRINAGRGFGASVVAQASADAFFDATNIDQLADVPTTLEQLTARLDGINRAAAAAALVPAQGEWLRFTPELQSMAQRATRTPALGSPDPFGLLGGPNPLGLESKSLAFPTGGKFQTAADDLSASTHKQTERFKAAADELNAKVHRQADTFTKTWVGGRLSVLVDDIPISPPSADIKSADALWTYCHDHDANKAAAALHAWDAAYNADDQHKNWLQIVALMVMFRGLLSKRDLTNATIRILMAAMGTDGAWAELQGGSARPAIAFLASIDLPGRVNVTSEAQIEFATAFTQIVETCKYIVAWDTAGQMELTKGDLMGVNIVRSMELQMLATLFRQLEKHGSTTSFLHAVGFLWRAKADNFIRILLLSAAKSGHLKEWISDLREFDVDDLKDSTHVLEVCACVCAL